MTFVPFDLERWQSTWENRVRVNLSESGVHPLTLTELLAIAGRDPEEVLHLPMGYSQSDGTDELRTRIAAMYPGASAHDVTVTVGSAEANFIACWSLIRPGDRVVVVAPTYFQTWGLARNFGASVTPLWLDPERDWEPDPDAVARAIVAGTRLVVVTNPNNPTGRVLSEATRRAVVERARATGAWLLLDEVYRGAELDGRTTPSWWGDHDRTLAVAGLSKAYGLPGLRVGWLVGPPEFKETLWSRHDYTVICPSPISDYLARLTLDHREQVLARTRGILNANYPMLAEWLASFDGLFTWRKPDAGAICFARYHAPVSGLELVDRIRREHDILLVPGEHFQMEGYLRFGYGNPEGVLRGALETLRPAMEGLSSLKA